MGEKIGEPEKQKQADKKLKELISLINANKYVSIFENIRSQIINFAESKQDILNNARLSKEARTEDLRELKAQAKENINQQIQEARELLEADREKLKDNPDILPEEYQRKTYYVNIAGQLIQGLTPEEVIKTYQNIAESRPWALSEEFYNLAEIELSKSDQGNIFLDQLKEIRKENMSEDLLERANDKDIIDSLGDIISRGENFALSLLASADNNAGVEMLKFRAESLTSIFDSVREAS